MEEAGSGVCFGTFEGRRLADLVDRLTNGYVGPTRDIYVSHGLPYLLARHVRNGRLQFDQQTFVSAEFNDRNNKSKLKTGDVLLVQSGHIGHSAVVGDEHDGHNCHAMIVLTPKPELLCGDYLSHFFSSPEMDKSFRSIRSGSTVPHLTCGAVRELLIPVPSIREQRRIVAILDEAFEGIATARANVEKNLQNVRELSCRQLESIFVRQGGQWPYRRLEQVATIINGFAFKGTDFQLEPGVRSIKIANVGVREFIEDDGNYLPSSHAQTYSGLTVRQGSIVLALTRTIITGGLKVAVVPSAFDGALLNQRVAAIQAHVTEMEPSFLYAYLSTRSVVDYVMSRMNTLMQPNLSIADLRRLPVPLPPLPEQRERVAELSRLDQATRTLESVYRRKVAALDELKRSLLHQAFTGAL